MDHGLPPDRGEARHPHRRGSRGNRHGREDDRGHREGIPREGLMAVNWIEKLEGVDRRAVFLVMGIAIMVPLFYPISLPIKPTPPVTKFYDFIESLPTGSRVLVSDDWDPGSKAELRTVSVIVHKHLRDRGVKVMDTCLCE